MEELLTKNMEDLYLDPFVREELVELLKEEKEVNNFEVVILGKEGERHYLWLHAKIEEQDGQPKIISVGRDVTNYQKAVKGAAWIESVLLVERQMMESQSLTGEFEVVSGASNSINQPMLPLAEKLSVLMAEPATEKYYEISEELGGGLTGRLQVTLKDKKITSVRYDEIFADAAKDIEAPAQKMYYGLSKYGSVQYDEPSRIGFNVQMDALNEKIVETQDLLDLSELPAIDESENYASSGVTVRNGAWDNYLKLANTLLTEMKADGNF